MKTYEKFIASNLFRKRKKLPKEIINFAEVLRLFIDNHIDPDWSVGIRQVQPEDKKDDDRIYIYFDPNTMDGTYNFVNLYYSSDIKKDVFTIFILTQEKNKKLTDIQTFLDNIFLDYTEDKHFSHKWNVMYLMKLDIIPEIVNSEDFDLFINANKYNL